MAEIIRKVNTLNMLDQTHNAFFCESFDMWGIEIEGKILIWMERGAWKILHFTRGSRNIKLNGGWRVIYLCSSEKHKREREHYRAGKLIISRSELWVSGEREIIFLLIYISLASPFLSRWIVKEGKRKKHLSSGESSPAENGWLIRHDNNSYHNRHTSHLDPISRKGSQSFTLGKWVKAKNSRKD